MATAFDKENLILRARRRADMEFSEFISEDEAEDLIEAAWMEFYLKVVAQFEDMCVVGGQTQAALEARQQTYQLPQNFLKLKAIAVADSNLFPTYFLRRITSLREMAPFVSRGRSGPPTHYWLHGLQDGRPAQIYILPPPDTALSLLYWYIPNIGLDTVSGTDGMSFVAGWDDYVVITAAMKMKDKEESDCSLLLAERNQLWDSMVRCLTPLDDGEPPQVVPFGGPSMVRGFNVDPYDMEGF